MNLQEQYKKLFKGRASSNDKKLLSEAMAWERVPGKPLPTLKDVTAKFNKSVNEGSKDEQVKKECISRLSDFFGVTPHALSKFNFDGKDNIKELTKALNSTSDKGTELYYQTAIKSVKRDLGVNESEVGPEDIDDPNYFKTKESAEACLAEIKLVMEQYN